MFLLHKLVKVEQNGQVSEKRDQRDREGQSIKTEENDKSLSLKIQMCPIRVRHTVSVSLHFTGKNKV